MGVTVNDATSYPICNRRGEFLSDSWGDLLLSGGVLDNGLYTFNDTSVMSLKSKYVWHGSSRHGTEGRCTCNNWNKKGLLNRSVGYASHTSGKLLSRSTLSCKQKAIVLCFGLVEREDDSMV